MSYPALLIRRYDKAEIMMAHRDKIKAGYKCLIEPVEITDKDGQRSNGRWVAKYTK